MKPNAFDVLKLMNENDIQHKTRTLAVTPDLLAVNDSKKGSRIEMGYGASIATEIALGKKRCILLVIDDEAYEKAERSLINDNEKYISYSEQFKGFM